MAAFAEAGSAVAGWLYACPSYAIRGRRIHAIVRHGIRLAVWRDQHRRAACVVARCPHWGADLAGGRISDGQVVCPLHGMKFSADGACVGGRGAQAFTTTELHGQVFIWWGGGVPRFALPGPPDAWTRKASRAIDSTRIGVHPHLATMNGLDLQHWQPVHGLIPTIVRELTSVGEWGLTCTVRLSGGLSRWVPGPPVELAITTWGATLCTLEARSWWGATWTLLANGEADIGHYISSRQVVAAGRWPLTSWPILMADAMLAGVTLRQDQASLARWEPYRERLSGPPWDQYLPLIARLPTWRPD